MTGEWGLEVHGVMPKVHLQLTPSSPHLPASKDWVKSWGDKGRDWEGEQVREVQTDISYLAARRA